MMREDARRKCGEMVVVEIDCERGEGRRDVREFQPSAINTGDKGRMKMS